MKKKNIINYIAMLLSVLTLSSCAEESTCELPSRHVHKYTKNINDDITIEEYIDSEQLQYKGFSWNEDYIEINKNDEKLYNLITNPGFFVSENKPLFVGSDNWDYLYYVMSNNHDYLMFYYHYVTTEIYYTTDSKGHRTAHTRLVTHNGWTNNPKRSHNTGEVRLYHHKYKGYRIVNKNGTYVLEESPLVDDIREVLYDYPYYAEDPSDKVYETFRYKVSELPQLKPEDFNVFTQPDLSNKGIILTRNNG